MQHQDPLVDFAIARVSRDTGESVEAQAGAGPKLGVAPKPGALVAMSGYTLDSSGPGGGLSGGGLRADARRHIRFASA